MLRRAVVQPASDTTLWLTASEAGLREIWFADPGAGDGFAHVDDDPLLRESARQLERYFAGRLREFDLPLDLQGTPFQIRVWNALRTIPYGRTISYAQLALNVDSPRGFRAVGAANGKNPIPIVVPCHRVIESGGGLGGFSCGLEYKRRLLDLEAGRQSWWP